MSLAHKGLGFERVPTAFTDIQAIENGASKTVPVIRDAGRVVHNSFDIALYLEESYPDQPTLFGGSAAIALSRFVEAWTLSTVHPFVSSVALVDIHGLLAPRDQAYFRASREKRMGRRLEEVVDNRDTRVEAFLNALAPLRNTLKLQPYMGGQKPIFADYIVFGAFQWLRITCPMPVLPDNDPVSVWVERCLDLHDGLGRSVSAASERLPG